MPDPPQTAIALRYDPEHGDTAPRVLASGKGASAEQILRLAQEHDIPLRRDPALASALSPLSLGASVPPELFRAVAEVLAFVYKLNSK
jgi:flagellar biosynthesis protein